MSTTPSLTSVLRKLADEGLVPPEAPTELAAATPALEQDPWYVRLLTFAGAVVAAFFLASALFLLGILDEQGGAYLAIGGVLVAATIALRPRLEALFLEQLALILSVVGSACVVAGVGMLTDLGWAALTTLIVVEGVVLLGYADFLRRLLATVAIVLGVVVLLIERDVAMAVHVVILALVPAVPVVWMLESRWVAAGRENLLRPVGYGLTAMLLALLVLSTLGDTADALADLRMWWIETVVLGAALAGVVIVLLRRLGLAPAEQLGAVLLAAIAALTALTLPAPGILGGLLVLVVGFHRGLPILMGLALGALVGFLAAYYYTLNLTLLAKSGVLVASGLVLLVTRLVVRRMMVHGGTRGVGEA